MPKKPTPEQQRIRHLRHRYRLEPGIIEQMFKDQDNKCYVCKRVGGDVKGQRLCVDHNHKTNKVRKLLCNRYNHIAGAIEDYRYEAVLEYLKEHNI